MKKRILGIILSICFAAGNAWAVEETWVGKRYFGLTSGYGFGRNAFSNGTIIGMLSGYKFNPYLRGDTTLEYRGRGDINFFTIAGNEQASVWSIPLISNIYATYPVLSVMDVYAMGGLGVSYNRVDAVTDTKGHGGVRFAWNIGAGAEWRLNRTWSIDVGYRLTNLGKGSIQNKGGVLEQSGKLLESHDVKLSLKYYF